MIPLQIEYKALRMCRNIAVMSTFCCLISVATDAQLPVDLTLILNPRIIDYTTFGSAGTTQYTSEDVKNQAAGFDLSEYRLTIGNQVWSSDDREILLLANYRRLDINTSATFPQTGLDVPDNLENFNVGLGYRQVFENDVLFGGLVQIGSASDEIFDSIDEVYIVGNFVTRIPRNKRDAWLAVLNINTNRRFPILPGFGFQHRGTVYRVIIGFPFLEGTYRPRQKLALHFAYFPPNTIDATATYSVSREFRVSGGFEWRESYFRRAARTDSDSLIEYDEKRFFGKVNFDIPNGTASLKIGYAFDRGLSEADDFTGRRRNEIEIADGGFVNAGVQLLF